VGRPWLVTEHDESGELNWFVSKVRKHDKGRGGCGSKRKSAEAPDRGKEVL